jgi:hypothetical protein
VEGPHHVAKNFDNIFCQKFQKVDFLEKKMQKFTFLRARFEKEGGAPGQKFFSGAGEVSDVFLVCHGVLLVTNMDHPRKKFLTRRTTFLFKSSSQKRKFLHFFLQKIYFLKFLTENVVEIFGNMMGTLHPRNIRRRGFMKFYVLLVKL